MKLLFLQELLITQIKWPKDLTLDKAQSSDECLKEIVINTILVRRWVAKQERMCHQNKRSNVKNMNKIKKISKKRN